jgi:hypothetical protein
LTEQMVDILSIFCKTSKSAEQIWVFHVF